MMGHLVGVAEVLAVVSLTLMLILTLTLSLALSLILCNRAIPTSINFCEGANPRH